MNNAFGRPVEAIVTACQADKKASRLERIQDYSHKYAGEAPSWRPAGRHTAARLRMPSWAGWLVAWALVLVGVPSFAQTPTQGVPLHGRTEKSLREVARQINNPISPLWQLTIDNAIVGLAGGGLDGAEPSYTGALEPQVPIDLSRFGLERFAWAENFQIVTRMIVPFIETVPLSPGAGGDRKSGFGDIQLGSVLAPSRLSGWVWGIGPTFTLPSASADALGQGKWQAGPAAVVGYVGKQWTASAVVQQWWSFAGDDDRPRTSQLCLAYTLLRSLPHRWQVGMQPSMEVDWTASGGNKVSFPVGLGFGRTVRIGKLPVQFWIEADYYAVHPDDVSGPRWGIDFQVIPVIPALF